MRIQEFQAKAFFKKYSIPVLDSVVVKTKEQALEATKKLQGSVFAVKAQVLAGGRGQAGGIKIVQSSNEVVEVSASLLGQRLKTHQTGEEGELIKTLLVETGCQIDKEYYLSLLVDPTYGQVIFMVSKEGGMDIEEVAKNDPHKIYKHPISFSKGLQESDSKALAKALGLEKDVAVLTPIFSQLYNLFCDKDASLIEINPFVKTKDARFIALDGKMTFDENAIYRHEDLKELKRTGDKDLSEELSAKYGFSFVKLDGDIACMVNGAGLAMATMDIIKFYGGKPANFLDVGGGAEEEKVRQAFQLILQFSEVRALLVNIFGGIMKCDVIANALISALKDVDLKIPIVVRLEGTRAEEGRKIIEQSGLNVLSASFLDEAAKKVVEAVK